MSSKVDVAVEDAKPVGIHPRLVALVSLSALAASLVYVGRGVYQAYCDSWVAPTTLSADDDRVIETKAKLSEQQLMREKARVDIERIDIDIRAIDSSIARLSGVRDVGQQALRWTAFTTDAQATAARQRSDSLEEQRKLFESMIQRQAAIAKEARINAEAGLASKNDVEREEQTLDQLRVNLAENRRDAAETQMNKTQLGATANVLRDALQKKSAQKAGANGTLPEIVERQDRVVALELELVKLESQKRSLETQRAMAVDNIARIDELFTQLKGRPVFRAAEAKTDLAFVPYTQLRGVEAGASLVTCEWALFRCRTVGRVAELLPGEVTAQDPWGTLARGQYAILDLSEHDAAREKVLRVRHGR